MDMFRTLRARDGLLQQRFWSADVTAPLECRLRVLPGSVGCPRAAEEETVEPMAELQFQRLHLAEGVRYM